MGQNLLQKNKVSACKEKDVFRLIPSFGTFWFDVVGLII